MEQPLAPLGKRRDTVAILGPSPRGLTVSNCCLLTGDVTFILEKLLITTIMRSLLCKMLHIPSEAVLERKLALSVEPEEKAGSLASQPLLRARQEDQSGLVVCSRLLLLKITAQPGTTGNNKGVICLWARPGWIQVVNS